MAREVEAADLILRNGRIYTVDRARPWAAAVAVRNGSFIAVGDDAAVEACRGPITRSSIYGGDGDAGHR